MFTGLVEELGTLRVAEDRTGLRRLTLACSLVREGLGIGDSVALNGACLTVVELAADGFTVELVPETLRRTNLGSLASDDRVNLERALPADGRFGGHLVQGHVDGVVTLSDRRPDGDAELLRCDLPPAFAPYVVEKGFVALDGVSLTVAGLEPGSFTIALIPYTRGLVTLGAARLGYAANLEVDILAKYVERLLGRGPSAAGRAEPSLDSLAAAGFAVPDSS